MTKQLHSTSVISASLTLTLARILAGSSVSRESAPLVSSSSVSSSYTFTCTHKDAISHNQQHPLSPLNNIIPQSVHTLWPDAYWRDPLCPGNPPHSSLITPPVAHTHFPAHRFTLLSLAISKVHRMKPLVYEESHSGGTLGIRKVNPIRIQQLCQQFIHTSPAKLSDVRICIVSR